MDDLAVFDDDLAVFDREGTLDRVDGDRELLLELFDLFFSESDEMLAAMNTSIETGNCSDLEKGAHAAKSALGNLGAQRCQALCFELEKLGRSGSIDNALELYGKLLAEVEEFRKATESERALED